MAKLAELLLRRKELQGKVDRIATIKDKARHTAGPLHLGEHC